MQYWDGIQWTEHTKSVAELPVSHLPPPTAYQQSANHTVINGVPAEGKIKRVSGFAASLFMIVFGLSFIGIGTLPLTSSLRQSSPADQTVVGTVVGVEESRSRKGGRTCAPVSAFTHEGKEYTVYSNYFQGPCPWHEGEPIELIYDPASPHQARVNPTTKINLTTFIFPAIGAGVAGFGVYLAIADLRTRRKAAQNGVTSSGYQNS